MSDDELIQDMHDNPAYWAEQHRTLESQLAATAPGGNIPQEFVDLFKAAYGLSFGADWNRGTHAEYFRRPLVEAVAKCKALLATTEPEPVEPDKRIDDSDYSTGWNDCRAWMLAAAKEQGHE